MPHIHVLDQVTIDKIAAGEVIERPASIVKELVENAIDAGATSVTVEIKDGGISLIRIMDNGCGIPHEEVRSAFLRHSTSKISSVEDLAHISSLGFRGEALSSIAAVTQTELITKTEEEELGTRYVIEGGKEISIEETGAPDGTTFLVRQLFYNVPARRKFLKTPMTEAGHVQDLLMHLALSHPEVAFIFLNNGQEKLRTSGSGKLKDVIYNVYGRDVAANLLDIDYEKGGLRITGYLGKPVITRGNRNFENFFVNGRYVKSPMISKSLEDAYRDFTMQHKFPFAVLHFHVDGEQIDVNVHPTKMELRFQRQQDVYNTVFEGVHRRLLEPELIQQAEVPDPVASDAKEGAEARTAKESPFLLKPRTPGNVPAGARPVSRPAVPDAGKPENSDASESPVVQPAAGVAARSGEKNEASQESKEEVRDEDYFIRKMRERVMAYHNRASSAEVSDKSGIYRQEEQADRIREAAVYNAQPAEEAVQPKPRQLDLFEENFLKRDVRAEYKLIGQVFDTYWLVQYQDSLYIIDQHAAHERVLYERTLKGMKTREFTSQYLSPPIILSLSMQEAELLKENMDRFARIGFEIEPFGGEEYAVRAVPDNLFGIAKKELLMEMIDDLADGISSSMTPELIDEKVASMSCKAAVKGNNRLSAQEVDALIGELLTLDNPYHCPHGRPTIIAMTKRELEKKFKRIV
ncbi:DNA mismatch repair endonuclease MutL [Mediterraneibacter glycyrrhizinilyticus]|uniref:DNA mismatch repair endonuclease MutL n=1 Tax=Mediterraneibacter glycyrrhizinilyticus TaxID=342942 RepID=UPI0025A45CED|nr:DNA mismatch repair endonuclease MutL [Mediterraneibacter glycyrrhizinilyticus]MDM8124816.1 DNA mismatch repair endonuclease MutL [Mediterraneibacter glycyrrhizinilyticus]